MTLARPIVFLALAACGDVGAIGDAGVDATITDASDGAIIFGDAAPNDVAVVSADVGLVDGGGLFPCGDCACDGRTHYCDDSQGPHAPIVGDAATDACTGGWGECVPLPDGCAPANCACLPNAANGPSCACFRSDAGDHRGLLVSVIVSVL